MKLFLALVDYTTEFQKKKKQLPLALLGFVVVFSSLSFSICIEICKFSCRKALALSKILLSEKTTTIRN